MSYAKEPFQSSFGKDEIEVFLTSTGLDIVEHLTGESGIVHEIDGKDHGSMMRLGNYGGFVVAKSK